MKCIWQAVQLRGAQGKFREGSGWWGEKSNLSLCCKQRCLHSIGGYLGTLENETWCKVWTTGLMVLSAEGGLQGSEISSEAIHLRPIHHLGEEQDAQGFSALSRRSSLRGLHKSFLTPVSCYWTSQWGKPPLFVVFTRLSWANFSLGKQNSCQVIMSWFGRNLIRLEVNRAQLLNSTNLSGHFSFFQKCIYLGFQNGLFLWSSHELSPLVWFYS